MTEALMEAAAAAHRAGDGPRAFALLEEVLAQDPDHPRALNSLALRDLAEGRAAQARDRLARAAAAAPTVAAIHLNLADAERALGAREQEIAALDAALAIDPYLVPALVRKGQALEALGRPAGREWRALLAIVPAGGDHPPALQAALAHAAAVVAAEADATAAAIAPVLADVRGREGEAAVARIDQAVAALLGRRRIYHPAPTGLHVPRLPADEFFDPALAPWLAGLEAATPAIRAEFLALLAEDLPGFAPYVAYAPGTPVNQWERLNHSPDWSAFYLWRDGKRDPEGCARCPQTAAVLDRLPLLDIPGRAPTAFFSLLRPGAHIPPHHGVTNARAIVHLPLVVPDGCAFRVGGDTRAWVEGKAWLFDDTIEHEAWNRSDRPRAILILDIWNPHLSAAEQAMLRALYPALDAARGGGPAFGAD